jgi:hypothetical protein
MLGNHGHMRTMRLLPFAAAADETDVADAEERIADLLLTI